MKNNAFPIFLAAWLILLAARGFTPAPAPVQTAETAEAVYTLEALSEEETFLSEGGRKLADYSYQLLVLSVANLEELSPEEAEAAQRNVETFHAKMSALMEELTAYGAVMGDDAAQMERDGYTIEAYYDRAAASGTMAGDLVSVRVDQCSYTGGAHPNRYTSSYLFDLRIGQFIDPTQLADDPAAFQCGAAELLREKADAITRNRDGYWPDYGEIISRWSEGAVLFDEEGMLVLYSTYELGPYVMGEVELRLSYEELAGLIGDGGLARLGMAPAAAKE